MGHKLVLMVSNQNTLIWSEKLGDTMVQRDWCDIPFELPFTQMYAKVQYGER